MKVLTGIDLPLGAPGGSVELLSDLYLGIPQLIPSDAFMLAAAGTAAPVERPVVLSVDGKALDGAAFRSYVDRLATALREAFTAAHYDVLHLQHLAFGATPALLRAFPELPRIAILHGTDLLFAEDHPTQARVLRETAAAAAAIVVPTTAMADRLARLVAVPAERIVHIPWGVPDELFTRGAGRAREPGEPLRVLYAGRLTAEKATVSILAAVAGLAGVELSVAAPTAEYTRLAERSDLSSVHHLGWLTRPALWREFDRHDLLIVPSRTLEAFGLVAVEAQARGLPVAFHAVPGLSEVLGDSALPLDFDSIDDVAAAVRRMRTTPALLDDLREAGRSNSARFPLSATASALRDLSAMVAR